MQPEPDSAFARRAGTAQLILSNTRVVTPTPAWRVRAERAASALAATLAVAWIALSASVVFALAADLGATPALTAVTTPQRQVGVLVDASPQQVQVLTQALAASGMHASFALLSASPSTADLVAAAGDGTPVPRLPDGGLFSWPSTRHRLRLLASECGWHHRHFLYASTGSSLGQYVLAKGAGGRLIGGQIRLASITSKLGRLHAGEVVEIRVTSVAAAIEQLQRLQGALLTAHLHAVPVQKLLRDSGTSV
jgi:hypothetical protein